MFKIDIGIKLTDRQIVSSMLAKKLCFLHSFEKKSNLAGKESIYVILRYLTSTDYYSNMKK